MITDNHITFIASFITEDPDIMLEVSPEEVADRLTPDPDEAEEVAEVTHGETPEGLKDKVAQQQQEQELSDDPFTRDVADARKDLASALADKEREDRARDITALDVVQKAAERR